MTRKPKTKAITQQNTTDEGSALDLSGIDNTLTDRAKRFVFWFCFPGTDCFQHKTRSAIRAGYAKKNAVSSGYKLCQNPVIKKEIERLSGAYVSEGIDT
ncbi:MAG: terminase small subunit, partial [Treponema sp.]|nr:terminase small subunit [Treponema sp.]